MTRIDVIIQGDRPIDLLIEINSIIHRMTNKSISLKFSPLCSHCIHQQLKTDGFSQIDDQQITTIERFDDFILSRKDDDNNNNNNNSSVYCNRGHPLRREEIVFGTPSAINNSKLTIIRLSSC